MTHESSPLFLAPGTLHAAAAPCAVSTVLGSCVAVCLFDPQARAGGINHYLLPYWNGDGLASPKYANVALPRLLERMRDLGARPPGLRAKLFGGASVFRAVAGLYDVGARNVLFAEEFLSGAGIPIVARDVGQGWTRKVIFHLHTGEAYVRRLGTQGLAARAGG